MLSKQALREQLLAQRRAMSAPEAAVLSEQIVRRVFAAVDWAQVHSLHTYLPFTSAREPDTHLLLRAIWQNYPHIKTASWQDSGGGHHAYWLAPDGFASTVPPGFAYDVIIVPLLGFNSERFRIGFGHGFYDRFLAAQPEARTIGLCYESGRCAFAPEPHDIPLAAIATEHYWYE